MQTLFAPSSDVVEVKSFFDALEKRSAGIVLIAPFDGSTVRFLRKEAHEKRIPYLFFGHDNDSACVESELSPFLWDFGASPASYSEIYLSYLGQRFGKLANPTGFYLYSSNNSREIEHTKNYKTMLDDLGFRLAGGVTVEERMTDLYTTLRSIFQEHPDLFLGVMTHKGRDHFLPQAGKLGFALEMGLAFDYGVEEEELRNHVEAASSFIVPATYTADISLAENENFRSQLASLSQDYQEKSPPTMANYRGYLIAKILNEMLSGKKFSEILNKQSSNSELLGSFSENFIKALYLLDGYTFEGPSGRVQIFSKVQSLIQPLHVSEFKEGSLKHVKFLGDVSLPGSYKCAKSTDE